MGLNLNENAGSTVLHEILFLVIYVLHLCSLSIVVLVLVEETDR